MITSNKTIRLLVPSRLMKHMAKRYDSSALRVLHQWQSMCKISQLNIKFEQSIEKNSNCVMHQRLFSAVWNAFNLNLQLTPVFLSWGNFASHMVLKAGKIKLRREAGIRMYQFGMLNNMRARLLKKLICLQALKSWQCATSTH